MDGIPPKKEWDPRRPPHNPFLSHEFFKALIDSRSVGPGTGWHPIFLSTQTAILPVFLKTDSYGEFIFDWSWAEAYQKAGLPYYPKVTSMIPFTPVTTEHFVMNSWDPEDVRKLLRELEILALKHQLTGLHFLFLTPEEKTFFENEGYLIRTSFQYHFFNRFESFDDYLAALKPRKAKQIKKERKLEVAIRRFTGQDLTAAHAQRMYDFYLSTIESKHSQDYLTKDFFLQIFRTLSDHILYVEASRGPQVIGASMFFFDQEKLYGRYWGSSEYVPFLHFELCYYQGMDFCFERKIPVFEAGAQGEHKLVRGFEPVKMYSAHKIAHPGFALAIKNFLKDEETYLDDLLPNLRKELPFRQP